MFDGIDEEIGIAAGNAIIFSAAGQRKSDRAFFCRRRIREDEPNRAGESRGVGCDDELEINVSSLVRNVRGKSRSGRPARPESRSHASAA